VQRYTGLPKVIGYSVIGAVAGFAGFTGAVWPQGGIGLFLLELGAAVVLFEAGGRVPLRWFEHNPMVLSTPSSFYLVLVVPGGMLLKQLEPRPWSWPRQMGTASSMLTMLMFVLVSFVAA